MWPMVEQGLSSQVGLEILQMVWPLLQQEVSGHVWERVGNLGIVLRVTMRMRKVSWNVAYMDLLQIVCGSPHKLKATTQRRGGKCDWG